MIVLEVCPWPLWQDKLIVMLGQACLVVADLKVCLVFMAGHTSSHAEPGTTVGCSELGLTLGCLMGENF